MTNLTKQAIDQRMGQEIADLQNLVESKLKLKNPADLIADPETPTPEVLAWALKLKGQNDIEKMKGRGLEQVSCSGCFGRPIVC